MFTKQLACAPLTFDSRTLYEYIYALSDPSVDCLICKHHLVYRYGNARINMSSEEGERGR